MIKYLKSVVLIIITISFCSTAVATEREDLLLTAYAKSDVIVRDLGSNKCMICNQFYPSFFLVTTGVTSAPQLYLHPNLDTIFDFEVFGGNVYFCGVKNGYGVLGYFPVAGFPFTTVQYLNVPSSLRLRRLEVGTMAGQTHMVAIGDGAKGYAEIVDAIDLGSSWAMHFFDASDATVVLTDLAITESHVVVSFYNITIGPAVYAKVLFLDKPTTPGGTFSPLYFQWRLAGQNSSTNIVIEACEEDAFELAYAAGLNIPGHHSVSVVAFNGTTVYASIGISEQCDAYVQVKDMEYYKSDKYSELLLDFYETGNHRSIVYHLDPVFALGNDNARGHLFEGYHITSLDQISSMPMHFWAAGINKTSVDQVGLYMYDFHYWWDCTRYISNDTKIILDCDDGAKLLFSHVEIEQIPNAVVEGNKGIRVENQCISN